MVVHFMGMSLRRLVIIFPLSTSSPHGAVQVLSTLKERTPLLERLEVKGLLDVDVANAVFNAALSLPQLSTFHTEYFTIRMVHLIPLAQLNHLRRISLALDENTHFINSTATFTPTFHSLETVNLATTTLSYATKFILRFLLETPLREFTLAFCHLSNQEDIAHLSSAMSQALPHSLMTTIRVWDEESTGSPLGDHAYALDVSTLQNLFVFSDLEVFTFNITMDYGAIDNNLIGDLVAHWPALRALSLVPTGRTPCPVVSLPLEGLIHFTKCRNLIYLNVLFDGSNIWSQHPARNGSSCPSLRYLDVHASPLTFRDLNTLASLISDIFPNLIGGIKSLEPSIEEDSAERAMLWSIVTGRYNLLVQT
ncbi:hypothetical protein HWV62_8032 [Athelia sp. TMB]|nr:hypothetical protein HWV62_8032 [Athelia sp. TMB]